MGRLKVGLIGKRSQLGKELVKVLSKDVISFTSKDLDLCYPDMIKHQLMPYKDSINVIVNCAAFNNVDKAETDPNCELINSISVKELAKFCEFAKILLIHISTDNVFDGIKGNYTETDSVNPINFYGESKLLGEEYIKKYCKKVKKNIPVDISVNNKVDTSTNNISIDTSNNITVSVKKKKNSLCF